MSWEDTIKKSRFKVAFPNTRFDYLKSHVVNGKEVIARVYSSKEDALRGIGYPNGELYHFLEENIDYSIQKLEPAHKDEKGNVYEWYIVLERNK